MSTDTTQGGIDRDMFGTPAATDDLITQFIQCVRDMREHDCPAPGGGEDLHCLNLAAYMGERMGFVLARLLDSEGERDRLRSESPGSPTASSLIALSEQKAADWQRHAEEAEAERDRLRERLTAADAENLDLVVARGGDAETILRLAEKWQAEGYVMRDRCAEELLAAFGVEVPAHG